METDYQSPLSKRYAADILSLLYEQKRIMATDLLRIAKNYKTVLATADALTELGLMTKHLESGTRLMKVFELTPQGEAVAEHLYRARCALYGTEPVIGESESEKAEKPKKSGKKSKKKSSKGENRA